MIRYDTYTAIACYTDNKNRYQEVFCDGGILESELEKVANNIKEHFEDEVINCNEFDCVIFKPEIVFQN